jgi:nucleoside-diphosphate-sugar epimerase|tara:strand:- start:43 stop:951 length:909 start_codon:yes stop_codon:yes gene_type:complete
MKKKILIIGGTGFIGYHLAHRCQKLNWDVTSVSTKKPVGKRRLKKVKYSICDISIRKKLKKIAKYKYDYLVNLGGYVDHINKRKTYRAHYLGAKNLFQVFKNKKLKAFIQIGSSMEYGGAKSPHTENIIGKPKGAYAKSKFMASKFLINCYEKYNFPVTVIRFYQLFGPNQDTNRFIPILINACLSKKEFATSSGIQSRDFLYVNDGIEAIIKSIKSEDSKGKIFNIGAGVPVKLKKIIEIVKQQLKHCYPIYGKIKLRKDEPMVLYPNVNYARKILNWKNKTTLKVGINKTIIYYRNFLRK